MNNAPSPLDYSSYLFVLAHPDDEVYTCAFMAKLIESRKTLNIIYVTSGDYNGVDIAAKRQKELVKSMRIIGLPMKSVHFFCIPERELIASVLKLCGELIAQTQRMRPDCIISHDFEGGHNGHDAVSFAAAYTAEKLNLPMIVFPAYHGWPDKRVWNEFVNGQKADFVLNFSEQDKELQLNVITAHQSQQEFFSAISRSGSNPSFYNREILRYISCPIDYESPPDNPIGYEYPGSKIKFEDFKKIISEIK